MPNSFKTIYIGELRKAGNIMILHDLTGERFGKLIVISRAENKSSKTRWLCECDCGNRKIINSSDLVTGKTTSCGCYKREKILKQNITHNKSDTRLYNIWCGMKQRCDYKENNRYYLYGGKGIKVCEEWKEFHNFYNWSMKNGYKDDLSIDRIDNSKNYDPENCRWVNPKVQGNNTVRNILIEYKGTQKTLSLWCDELNLPYHTIYARIHRLNWEIERVFSVPIKIKNRKLA